MNKNRKSNGKSLCSCRKLAMDGGQKVRSKPWPARKLLGKEEKKAVDALFDKAIASGLEFGQYPIK